jgi:hypothetical protein
VDDWMARQFTLLGIPFQNWMVVAIAMIIIAVLITRGERD